MSMQCRQFRSFRDLSADDLRQLIALLNERSFSPGEEIGAPGNTRAGLPGGYLVPSGQVQLSLRDEGGRDAPLDVVAAGEYFGVEALVMGDPRQVRARALTKVALVELDSEVFFAFLERHPKSARYAIMGLARRLRETEHLLQYRASRNANVVDEASSACGSAWPT